MQSVKHMFKMNNQHFYNKRFFLQKNKKQFYT